MTMTTKDLGENLSQCHMFTINPTLVGLILNPGHHGDRLLTNLGHGMGHHARPCAFL